MHRLPVERLLVFWCVFMTMKYRFGFIGAGAMAETIASGMIQQGVCTKRDIIMSNRSKEKLLRVKEKLGITAAESNHQVVAEAEYLVIAVKPQQFHTVVDKLEQKPGKDQTVISIMAGVPIKTIEQQLGKISIFRAMPNTPAKIGWGMTGVCAGSEVTEEQKQVVLNIFDSVGKTVFVDESYMDAIGAVSGCGPAYMYQILEAIADGAVLTGLPRNMAYELAAQTMAGSAMMLLETGLHPGALKDQVTSPGGTTIRAIKTMEDKGVRSAMIEAVEQAYLRSKDLGEK